MSKSLQQHGCREINKQLRFRMIASGLNTIQILVPRRSGKFKFNFTGSAEQVVKAEALLAALSRNCHLPSAALWSRIRC